MNKNTVISCFGHSFFQALLRWKARGYDVVQHMGVVEVSNPEIRVRVKRWEHQAQILVLHPNATEINIPLVVDCPYYDSSQKVAQAVELQLNRAESARFLLTAAQRAQFGHAWREFFAEADQMGFTICYGKEGLGTLSVENGNTMIYAFLHRDQWTLSLLKGINSIIVRLRDDDAVLRAMRAWIAEPASLPISLAALNYRAEKDEKEPRQILDPKREYQRNWQTLLAYREGGTESNGSRVTSGACLQIQGNG